jgi:hypothetical protein
MNIITNTSELKSMKIIDMRTKSAEKAYVTRPPEDTHSKEELDAVHRAIRFTHAFKHQESMEKMNEEEDIERAFPNLKKLYEKPRQ